MTTLVVGANGATGRQLVKELLSRNVNVKIIVRGIEKLPYEIRTHQNLTILDATILHLSDKEMEDYVKDCDAVASCLGHNISLRGIFGKPKLLVTDAVRRLCDAIKEHKPGKPVKFVLMNTTANNNKDANERLTLKERLVFSFIRMLLPPHRDNEQAADYLRKTIGPKNEIIEWSIVRPDSLINENIISEYRVFSSPIRSPLFNAGKTSRINVGHFMSELITNDTLWEEWKGKMPVIYNITSCPGK